ncbi:hypothetical protein [Laspinema palackyanum]|uniref:hypothetical protein n=1 Tax=Laspinema palackyanum TaxID=3231601 RepID=UPI00345D3809|nr:hypothetical protein [Laspinema sp. D2c]
MSVKMGIPIGSSGVIKQVGNYGFMTNIDMAEASALGQAPGRTGGVAGSYIQNLIIGGDAPRPARVTKKTVEYSVTSYVGYDKIAQALASGWKQSAKVQFRAARQSKLSKLVFVTIRGVKYAWRMRAEQYNKIKGFASNIGFKEASQNDADLVYGATFPKPPKIGITITGEGGMDNLSTFCDPTKIDDLKEGWVLLDPGNYGNS